MGRKYVANYEEEKNLFAELVASDREPNILLLRGESGSGKSHLIDHFLDSIDDILSVYLPLGSSGNAVPGIFSKIGRRLSWENLPRFSDRVVDILQRGDDEIDRVSLHRFLPEIGRLGDMESRLTHFQILTDAFFADVQQLDQPLLLAFDAYEKVSTQLDQWLQSELLTGVAETGALRILVGGQNVPHPDEKWGYAAEYRELSGITDVNAWLIWAARERYSVPDRDILAEAVSIIGNPSRIVQFIRANPQKFPRAGTSNGSRLLTAEQRRRLRANIVNLFNLEELKDICFDLGINWENLPDHDRLASFARELLSYAIRASRLPDLLASFQAERPPEEQWVI
jgi:hypothetical protein